MNYIFDLDLFTNEFPDEEKLKSAEVTLTESGTFVFELPKNEFKKVQNNFRDVDRMHKSFKIDISGVEFIFLLDELLNDEKDKT